MLAGLCVELPTHTQSRRGRGIRDGFSEFLQTAHPCRRPEVELCSKPLPAGLSSQLCWVDSGSSCSAMAGAAVGFIVLYSCRMQASCFRYTARHSQGLLCLHFKNALVSLQKLRVAWKAGLGKRTQQNIAISEAKFCGRQGLCRW